MIKMQSIKSKLGASFKGKRKLERIQHCDLRAKGIVRADEGVLKTLTMHSWRGKT